MDKKVSLVPKFLTSTNNMMMLARFGEDDIEYYVVEAIKKCYHYGSETPEFYEIFDEFIDLVITSNRIEFYLDGISVRRPEINESTLEYMLTILKIEYRDFAQITHNECQNIIMKELL